MALTLAESFEVLFGGGVPLALHAFHGSSLDRDAAVGLIEIRTPRAAGAAGPPPRRSERRGASRVG